MDLEQFKDFCSAMKQYNVTSFKFNGVEINMQPQMDLSAFSQPGSSQPSDDELLENPYAGLEV